jgi:16S rRNA (adenine1518-N6/adenine1519-N6)-dimethyltransferase
MSNDGPYRHKKSLGQHFLRDPVYLARIVAAIRPDPSDRMVEIGPGLGALTRPLLEKINHLRVVEFDRDLVPRLRAEFPPERLTVHEADALKFDFGALGDDLRIVGNLPYNISSPILFHLATYAEHIRDMHFMLQKEVVDRMAATADTPDYGRLSVMLQARFKVIRLSTSLLARSTRPPR